MDIKQIQSIIKDFEKSNITSLEIELEGFKLKLNKDQIHEELTRVVRTNTAKEVVAEKEVEETLEGTEVKSPLVGTYYSSSNPKDNPFASVGQRVEKGQTVCIIEAMKIMNEITAPVSGVIEAINVKNGSPVGFDTVIMVIA
ncbi:MAG: accB [Haloplasmataceae bacterium]|nr:accB [Haloplasmataceae bacterium]